MGYFDDIGLSYDDGEYDDLGAQFGAEFGAEFGASGGGDEEEYVMVGIPPTVFGGAGTQVIQVPLTQPFRADKLMLDAASQAAGCVIEQISISSVDQNRGDGDLPADMFTDDATHTLAGNIVDPGVGIQMRVTTAGALTFRGAFFGPARPLAEVARSAGRFDKVICGIPNTTVGIGATAVIVTNPTQHFRASQLVLDATSRVADVTVDQISISSIDQNRASGAGVAPAEIFAPRSRYRLKGTIAKPGVGIRMTVTNNTAGAVNIGGAFFGKALAR